MNLFSKIITVVILNIFNFNIIAQDYQLTNQKLIEYYNTINKAEIHIVNGNLTLAKEKYEIAFKANKEPHAKDIFNNMQVLIKLKDYKNAYANYNILECFRYEFEKDFFKSNFPPNLKFKEKECKNKIDYSYKKTLDSLFEKDQYFRKLSTGNYKKYQKEMTEGDSLNATKLYQLIQKKGFPNEYNIGLSSSSKIFFHNFYYIIWHQLATNLYSPQQVNFSKEMEKALNEGKLTPEWFQHLSQLNDGTDARYKMHFSIHEFITSNGTNEPIYDQMKNGNAKKDCCYVHQWFFAEKRNEEGIKIVEGIDEKRKKIGLSNLDDDLKKKIFFLDNNTYHFSGINIEGHQFADEKQGEEWKKHLIKIKETKK